MQLQVETFTFCCREYCTFGTFEERFEVSLDAERERAIGSFSQEKREVLSQDIDRTTTTSEISEKALFEAVDTLRHCARTPVLTATTENLGLSNLDGDS